MFLIALWPKSLVGATTATLERTIAPAQVAAGRPADEIRAVVVPNRRPPSSRCPATRRPGRRRREPGRRRGDADHHRGRHRDARPRRGPGATLRRHGPALVGAGIVAAFVMTAVLWGDRQEAFNGGLRADRFSLMLGGIFLAAALLTIMLAWREPTAVDRRGEFVSLILVSTTGMMLVAAAGDLISIFLGIEILSVALYVLCGSRCGASDPSRRPQVPDHRRGRRLDPAVRPRAAVRRGRLDQPRRDRRRAGRRHHGRRAAGGGRDGADRRGTRLQGVGGAVPHVDARRLRGRADHRDRVHGDRDQGGGVRRVPEDLRRRAADLRPRLAGGDRPWPWRASSSATSPRWCRPT